ncbi:MAG: 4Fe-4S dicluster domain-containing protein [Coriobacteriaceae bacterium]|nr:4Fe-4S dicluster domain-containing protein [Coriobacteriaceae bacterium]
MVALEQNISKLGFGLMRLPKFEDGTTDIEQVKQMVDAFMAAGGTYFDTARAYGSSEADIRQALVERYPRESFYLATKNAAWIGCKTAEEARALFDTSLEQTGAGYFDFYLIHNTGGTRTKVFDDFKLWDFVKELKAAGKVRHIGFSHHDNAELLDELLTKHPEMEFVQLQVNYADWENPNIQSRACVEVARKHGKPVVVMEPVRGGLLANPPQAVAEILQAQSVDRSFADWALRFAMNAEGVMTVLSGMSTLQQMEENLQTWRTLAPLADDERETLLAAQRKLDELMDNPCTACHYCMKECPMEINISGIMDALNRNALYGHEAGAHWYAFSASEGHRAGDCIQCGQCEDACPQHIEIVSKLEDAADLFD